MRDESVGQDLADLVELYALDALPDEERDTFESALAAAGQEERSRVEAQIEATREAAARLAEQFATAPPARARTRLLAQTAMPKPRRVSRQNWISAGAVAACVALLAVEGWWHWRVGELRGQVKGEASVQGMSNEASMVMTAADAHMAMGKIAGQQGMVAVTYSRSMDKAVVLLSPTTRIPENKVYQVWLVDRDHAMASAGMLAPNEVGRPMLVAGVGSATAVMLSLEPSSGMPQPTGAMVSEVGL